MTAPADSHGLPASPAASPAGDGAARPSRRLDGIDVARALAIIGMISIHVGPVFGTALRSGEFVGWYAVFAYGKASTLFAFVAGLGITLGSRRGTFTVNAARLAWRAAWLLPLGLFLGLLGTPVAVILQYYALWFVLAIPFLRAPTWVLGAVTAVGVVVGPTLLVVTKVTNPEWYLVRGGGRGIAGILQDLLITGYYPTVSWLWIVLAGMAVARLDLGRHRVAGALTVVGAGVAASTYAIADLLDATVDLGAYQAWFSTVGHADTTLETVAATGVAAAVTGACLLLADLLRPLLSPLAALGRLALTVYVGHIIVYAVARDLFWSTTAEEVVTTTLWITGVSTVFAVAWLSVFERGPLETVDRAGYEHLVRPLVERPDATLSPTTSRETPAEGATLPPED